MPAAVLLISILTGLTAALAALIAGTGVPMALLAYVIGGSVGAVLVVLRALARGFGDS